jgi:hypothetical protein
MKKRIIYEHQFLESTFREETGDVHRLQEELDIHSYQGWEIIDHSVFVDKGIKKISVMLRRDTEFDPLDKKNR